MSRIIFHCGLPKSASSTIQSWLAAQSGVLRERHDIDVLVSAKRADPWRDPPAIVPHARGPVSSSRLVRWYDDAPQMGAAFGIDDADEARRGFMDQLLPVLEGHAADKDIVLTCEGMWRHVWPPSGPLFEGLSELATRHHVELVMYVRPQHEFLEASWRQWGFRTLDSPGVYLERLSNRIDYHAASASWAAAAPDVHTTLRPLDPRALHGGDVVTDFATSVLGLAPDDVGDHPLDANVGLPLHAVNLLSRAPRGRFFAGAHKNQEFDQIKALDFDWPNPAAEQLAESRRILQAWCHALYEADNRSLIEARGWPVDGLIDAVDGLESEPDFHRLDELWAPPAEVDLDHLWLELDRAIAESADRNPR